MEVQAKPITGFSGWFLWDLDLGFMEKGSINTWPENRSEFGEQSQGDGGSNMNTKLPELVSKEADVVSWLPHWCSFSPVFPEGHSWEVRCEMVWGHWPGGYGAWGSGQHGSSGLVWAAYLWVWEEEEGIGGQASGDSAQLLEVPMEDELPCSFPCLRGEGVLGCWSEVRMAKMRLWNPEGSMKPKDTSPPSRREERRLLKNAPGSS